MLGFSTAAKKNQPNGERIKPLFKGRCGIYQTDEGFTNIFPMSDPAVNAG